MTTPYNEGVLTDRLGSFQDRVFDATALPDTASIESAVFQLGKVQGEVELSIIANSEITIADTKSITFELFYDDAEDGAFTNSDVMKAFLASGSSLVFGAGTTLFNYTPSTDVAQYAKVKVTTTDAQSAGAIDGKLFRTA